MALALIPSFFIQRRFLSKRQQNKAHPDPTLSSPHQ
jgi:hypothetical protein